MGLVPLYRDEAVVLRTHKLGEADRIITVLTRTRGKVRAVAKGVRRTGSRFGARLEPFMVIDLQCYEGRNLDTVTQAETLAPHGDAICRDYSAYTAATAVVETCDRLTEEHEPSTQQYLLLAGALAALVAREHEPGLVLDAYLLRSLAVAGLGAKLPRLREVRRARSAPVRSTSPQEGWSVRYAVRPAARLRRRPLSSCSRRCYPGTGRLPMPAIRSSGARAVGWSRHSCSGTSSAGCAPCAMWNGPALGNGPAPWNGPARSNGTPRDGIPAPLPAPVRSDAPDAAGRAGPGPRRRRHGRQRPLGERPRTAQNEGP